VQSVLTTLKRYLWAYLPAVFWAGTIFYLSSQASLPSLQASLTDFVFKKGAHMFVYAVLYILLYRAVYQTTAARHTWLHLTVPIVLTLLYAVSDELHQSFIPGRFPTTRDIGYDVLGMSIAFLRIYRYI
jgi:VanZ family protein